MEKIYHHRSQLLEMTLVDHTEAIEQKRGTMKGEKEGGRKMVKKEMKTVTGIKRGQEYGWIPDGTENKKDHCISQLPLSKKVAGLIPALGLSLCHFQLSMQDSYKLAHHAISLQEFFQTKTR